MRIHKHVIVIFNSTRKICSLDCFHLMNLYLSLSQRVYLYEIFLLKAFRYPKEPYVKSLLVIWATACFVLAKSYEGTFTAILAIAKAEIPIKNLHDLAHQSKYNWKIEKGSFFYDQFKVE